MYTLRSSPSLVIDLRSHLQSHIDLTKYASHVYVLVRRDELRASRIMAKRLLANPKIVSGEIFNIFSEAETNILLDCRMEYCAN